MLPTSEFEIITYNPSSSIPPSIPHPTSSDPEPIALQTGSSWSHAGSPLDPTNLPESYHTWSRGTFQTGNVLRLLVPFLTFLHEFLAKTDMTHYLLTIRAQKATSDFDIPRWHVDRRFFQDPRNPPSPSPSQSDSDSGSWIWNEKLLKKRKASTWKLATALMGPGTLFLKNSTKGRVLLKKVERDLKLEQKKRGHYAVDEEHICKSFRCLGCAEMAEAVRFKLADEIEANGLEFVQTGRGQVAVFRVDGTGEGGEGAAMHSEPMMSGGDRVFVHVVPGREEELRQLVVGWGMEYPKDWSVGIMEDWVV